MAGLLETIKKMFQKPKLEAKVEILREPEYDNGTFKIYVRNVTSSPLYCGVTATEIGQFGEQPSVTILQMKGADMRQMSVLPPKESRSVEVLRFDSDLGTLTLLGKREHRPLAVVRQKLLSKHSARVRRSRSSSSFSLKGRRWRCSRYDWPVRTAAVPAYPSPIRWPAARGDGLTPGSSSASGRTRWRCPAPSAGPASR
jgi:hypothetical protein